MPETYQVRFDLASSQYSARAESFYLGFQKFQTKGSVVAAKYDGDFTIAKRNGAPIPEHPFAAIGDVNTTILRVPYIQDLKFFQPQLLGNPLDIDGRYMLIDEDDFRDVGGRIAQWTRVYAMLPPPHDELSGCSHAYQYISSRSPLTLGEKQFTVACKIRTEFFTVGAFQGYPPLQASRFEQFTDRPLFLRRGKTQWNLAGDLFVTSEPEIVAEDSELGYWHYPICFRKTRWVPGPTLDFWGSEYTLPGA